MSVEHFLKKEAEAAKWLLGQVAETVGDDEEDRTTVVEGETRLLDVIDRAIERIATLRSHREAMKKAVDRIAERKERMERAEERIGEALRRVLTETGIGKQERPLATINIAKNPKVITVYAEHDVPPEYFKTPEPVLNKAEVNKAMREGKEVPGVRWDDPEKPNKLSIKFA